MKKILTLLLLILIPTTHTFAAFSYYRSVTIDKTKVSGAVATPSNFPVLINGVYSYLATTGNGGRVQNANGYDVGFYTSSDCATGKMNWETVMYSATTGTVEYWVKASSLSTTTDTVFYMCMGDSSITTDQSNVSGVWDANYVGVWHMGTPSSLSATDSIGNGNGTIVGSPSSGAGKIGGGLVMTGTSQYINAGNSSVYNFTSSAFTVEAWLKHNSTNPNFQTFIKRGDYTVNGWYFQTDNASPKTSPWFATNQSGTYQLTAATTALNKGGWTHLVAVRNGSSVRIYADGVDKVTSAGSHNNPTSVTTDLLIGTWKDIMDEVRISNTNRSLDWIKTEYNNQSATSTFYTIGSENSLVVVQYFNRMIVWAKTIINSFVTIN